MVLAAPHLLHVSFTCYQGFVNEALGLVYDPWGTSPHAQEEFEGKKQLIFVRNPQQAVLSIKKSHILDTCCNEM